MKKLKIKKLVLPMLYLSIIAVSFFSVFLINKTFTKTNENDYSESLLDNTTQTVLATEEESKFVKPYLQESVSQSSDYYSKDDDDTTQTNSLIVYEGTYMPSTGVMYESDETFDVISTYEGEVTNISDDEILGKVIEVTHSANLVTYYYSLTDLQVNKGDKIKTGQLLGKATPNNLNSKSSILFEVYYQGNAIDPNNFYITSPNDYK